MVFNKLSLDECVFQKPSGVHRQMVVCIHCLVSNRDFASEDICAKKVLYHNS